MKILYFMLYALLGVSATVCLTFVSSLDLPLALCAGAILTALLGQIHLFCLPDVEKRYQARFDQAEKEHRKTSRRLTVLEARTDAVESTVKQELTERRDALVSEMKQLESLIDRLSRNFESRLGVAELSGSVPPQDDILLRQVKAALLAGRTDLHLQPVVSLPQRRVSFYEGFTRLRRPDGSLILPADFLDAARRARLIGIIDNMMLYRSVEVVRRLTGRDRRVGVFCNISAYSLEDPDFFPYLRSHLERNRDLAGALIFELRADQFRTRSSRLRKAMDQLTALGFRFSLDHAETLAFDLPDLQDAGVRFVKIRGDDLISQLRDPDGPRPFSSVQRPLQAEDVSALCSRYGVTLIVEKVEAESSVVEILEYAIAYGQGHIFGVPRPIKSSLMQETAPPEDLVRHLTHAIG